MEVDNKNQDLEVYTNFSQNFRSVTFADISIINPAYAINPSIDDEKGFTFDLGFRGNFKEIVSFTHFAVLFLKMLIKHYHEWFPSFYQT